MPPATAERPPVKSEGSKRVTFHLTEAQRRELLSQMARKGETSTSRFLVEALRLDAPTNE